MEGAKIKEILSCKCGKSVHEESVINTALEVYEANCMKNIHRDQKKKKILPFKDMYKKKCSAIQKVPSRLIKHAFRVHFLKSLYNRKQITCKKKNALTSSKAHLDCSWHKERSPGPPQSRRTPDH